MLSMGAFNALLKVLEEPPPHVVFILATTESYKIPYTIVSRCQRFRFNRISVLQLAQRIKYVCEKEKIIIEDEAANQLAALADGSARDAISMLDQCSSNRKEILTLKTVLNKFGFTSQENVINAFENFLKGDLKQLTADIYIIYKKSYDLKNFCEQLLEFSFAIIIYKVTEEIGTEFIQYREKIKIFSQNFSNNSLLEINEILKNTIFDMNKGAKKLISVESAMIKILNALSLNNSESIEKIEVPKKFDTSNKITVKKTNKTENIDSVSQTEKTPKPDVQKAKSEEKIAKSITVPTSNNKNETKVFEQWHEILQRLSKKSKLLYMAFNDSTAYENGDSVLMIDSNNPIAFDYLEQSGSRKKINDAVFDVTGKTYKFTHYQQDKLRNISEVKSQFTKDHVLNKKEELSDPLDNLIQELKEKNVDLEVR